MVTQIQLEKINDKLNEIAEVSFEEHRTTDYLESLLGQFYTVHRFSHTGLYITIPGRKKETIAFRTDIDGLPFSFDGKLKVLHACGHDAHMTILIGLLLKIKDMNYEPEHTLMFIFQPAEESGKGSRYVADHKILNDVSYLFGMHLRPKVELSESDYAASIQHGASSTLDITIVTPEGHAGRPWESVNSIEIACEMQMMIKALHTPGNRTFSAKMTTINTVNGTHNTIPGTVNCLFDVRAQYNDIMAELKQKIQFVIDEIQEKYDCEITASYTGDTFAAEVDAKARKMVESVLKENENSYVSKITTPGAEDFHMYNVFYPKMKTTMLGIGCNMKHSLHHPEMSYDKSIFIETVDVFYQLLEKADAI